MAVKEKSKTNSNGTEPKTVNHDFVIVSDITQLQMEQWSDAFAERGGLEVKGLFKTAGAYVRALVDTKMLLHPAWVSDDDVDNASPALIIAIFKAFDATYGELTEIDPN